MAARTLFPDALAELVADVCEGLSRPQKEIPSKYLYDEAGSALFEQITQLPEYGLARAGDRLMNRYSAEVVERLPQRLMVAELGSGSGKRTRPLLEALCRREPATYFPIEISTAALAASRRELAAIPGLTFRPVQKTYLDGLRTVVARRGPGESLLVLFLGGTIGNFERSAALEFLRKVRGQLVEGDALLLAADLEKPADQLVYAYDDALGLTAAFNLNMLTRLNRELGAGFDLRFFRHVARYNSEHRRIEMHLQSTCTHVVRIPAADLLVTIREGETIWTESSHRYSLAELQQMTAAAGFRTGGRWVDAEWPFVHALHIV